MSLKFSSYTYMLTFLLEGRTYSIKDHVCTICDVTNIWLCLSRSADSDYNSSLSRDIAAGGPARAPRLQLGQERLLHGFLQCDALQMKIFKRSIKNICFSF